MPAARTKDAPSELFQTVLLTLAMTGGGLMLFFLVVQFYMVPSVRQKVDTEIATYAGLTKVLDSDDMHRLRAQWEAAQAEGAKDLSLQQIIMDKLEVAGVTHTSLPQPRDRDGAEVRSIRLQPANLGAILRYVVGVTQAKKTVKAVSVKLQRSRGGGDFDATIEFIDHAPPKSS